jgi:anti-sigma B factor antagonist
LNLAPRRNPRECPAGPRPSPAILALSGELDIATAPGVLRLLNGAVDAAAEQHRRLIIDLSDVSFCDASGLTALIRTHNRARELRTPVFLAGARPHVRKLLRITRLDRGMNVHATLTDAIAA